MEPATVVTLLLAIAGGLGYVATKHPAFYRESVDALLFWLSVVQIANPLLQRTAFGAPVTLVARSQP